MPTGPRHFMVMPDFSRASIPSIGKMDRTRSVRPFQRERERERGRGVGEVGIAACQNIAQLNGSR